MAAEDFEDIINQPGCFFKQLVKQSEYNWNFYNGIPLYHNSLYYYDRHVYVSVYHDDYYHYMYENMIHFHFSFLFSNDTLTLIVLSFLI